VQRRDSPRLLPDPLDRPPQNLPSDSSKTRFGVSRRRSARVYPNEPRLAVHTDYAGWLAVTQRALLLHESFLARLAQSSPDWDRASFTNRDNSHGAANGAALGSRPELSSTPSLPRTRPKPAERAGLVSSTEVRPTETECYILRRGFSIRAAVPSLNTARGNRINWRIVR
jgi:hypothetical protein